MRSASVASRLVINHKYTAIVVLCNMLCTFGQSARCDEPSQKTVEMLLEDVRSEDAYLREDARHGLRKKRENVIKSMMAVFETKSDELEFLSAKDKAVYILGEYRAVEAVDLLAKNIAYQSPFSNQASFNRPLINYLAAQALVKIGCPSREAIRRQLIMPATVEEMKLFTFVILEIDGEEMGLFRLERWLEQAETQRAKRLEFNIRYLRNMLKTMAVSDWKKWPSKVDDKPIDAGPAD
ncbi:MAG: hypothetical protein ACREQV_05220 [Candidatus Binatia bacterium]